MTPIVSKVLAMKQDNHTDEDIARELKISQGRVRKILEANGMGYRDRLLARKNRIVSLREEDGMSATEIAKVVGVNRTYVYEVLKTHRRRT